MAKQGKNYRAAKEKVEHMKLYTPEDAIKLMKEISFTKFDGTVEVHIRLGVDPRHADQQVRDTVVLPHGLGKEIRVLVFAQGDGARAARDAGAEMIVDDDESLQKVQDGYLDFDVAISTPEMMSKAGRLGRVLGPRGLMPNPKAGTVVREEDLARTIEEVKAGRVEFRVDKTANLHVPIGKVSFEESKLVDNLAALMNSVKKARPAATKGTYMRRITLASTMGPGILVDPNLASSLKLSE